MKTGWRALTAAVCSIVLLAACSVSTDGPLKNGGDAPSSLSSSPPQLPREIAQHLQTVSGLGVNANVHSWKNGQLKPAIDRIAELGDLTWRVIIEKADWLDAPDQTTETDITLDRYRAVYEHGKMADLWDTIAYINSKHGQQVMVNIMGGVPEWMGGTHIDPASEDQWVRMVASMVAYGRNVRHLDFTMLGPMNEIDWNGIEGPQVQPDQYVRLLHKLLVQLDQLGLSDIRLVGPDTASAANGNSDYLPALASEPLVIEDRISHSQLRRQLRGSAGALKEASYPGMDYSVTGSLVRAPARHRSTPTRQTGLRQQRALVRNQTFGAGRCRPAAIPTPRDGNYKHQRKSRRPYSGGPPDDASTGVYTPRKNYFVLRQFVPLRSARRRRFLRQCRRTDT